MKPAHPTPNEDTQPWYRQFWPWFLIALPGSVVVAALATLFIAARHADDLVVDEYYRSGLAINLRLEKEQRAHELGIEAQVRILDRKLQLRTRGVTAATGLLLRLSHPFEAQRDFSVELRASAPGLYLTELESRVAPNWHWSLEASSDSDWRLSGSLVDGDFLAGRSP